MVSDSVRFSVRFSARQTWARRCWFSTSIWTGLASVTLPFSATTVTSPPVERMEPAFRSPCTWARVMPLVALASRRSVASRASGAAAVPMPPPVVTSDTARPWTS